LSNQHLFVSYAREDSALAKKVVTRLRKLNVNAWQDVRDLVPGQKWEEEIDDALRSASALIVIVTKAALRSRYVAYEWAFAAGVGAKIIPVVMEKVTVRPPLSRYECIDYTSRGKPWLRLADALDSPISRGLRRRSREPGIAAEFYLVDGAPWYEKGDELAIRLSIVDAPRGATRATYRLHDESFEKTVYTSRSPKKAFETDIQSYGDVLVSATIQTRTGSVVRRTTLYEALRTAHGGDKNEAVKKALEQIRTE
jgi:hypothetical protein